MFDFPTDEPRQGKILGRRRSRYSSVRKAIEKELGNMEKKTSLVLKRAIKETTKYATKKLKRGVKNRYLISGETIEKEIFQDGKVSVSNLSARIIARGEQHELKEFQVSPFHYEPDPEKKSKKIYGKILKKGKRSELKKGNLKAFVIEFSNGHQSVVQRTGKDAPDKSRLGHRYIKKLIGPSIKVMAAQVWKEQEEDVRKHLQDVIQKHINKVLGG